MIKQIKKKKLLALSLAATLAVTSVGSAVAYASSSNQVFKRGEWLAGDFHTHTYLTDGSHTQREVLANAFDKYGLDWLANSEHGGTSARDTEGNPLPEKLWRWLTLKDFSFPLISELRQEYADKLIVQGVEWNVPTHEHASVAIIDDEPSSISDFEYMFDAGDKDTSRTGITKQNVTHPDAVAGAKWLQDNYPTASYFLINHPSRALRYSVADIRDFNNAAPDVCFGFEGLPGHQKSSSRGGYGGSDSKARTYGGADYMVSQVGGLWDALLGEGREFWVFVNSDFHSIGGDFWPGEYAKSVTFVEDSQQPDYLDLLNGLRSGTSFAVHGDLIEKLEFSAKSRNEAAVMGETLKVMPGANAQLTIRFKSPEINNNGDHITVDHIDLIAGEVTGKVKPGTPEYQNATNPTTKVLATFTNKDWTVDKEGYCVIKYNLKSINQNMYFRLRGTNLGFNVANETDAQGNPLVDSLMGTNNAEKAYQDLWFYSNPIFLSLTKEQNDPSGHSSMLLSCI